jgi:hypothetical protein
VTEQGQNCSTAPESAAVAEVADLAGQEKRQAEISRTDCFGHHHHITEWNRAPVRERRQNA